MVRLTNRELVKRINNWIKKPKAKDAPVCYHNETHGRLKAVIVQGDLLMSCTQCDFKVLTELPERAYRKVV